MMPIIEVNLVPPKTDPEVLKQLCLDLLDIVASIPELKLTNRDTTVLLRTDILEWGIGSEIIVFVDGLIMHPGSHRPAQSCYRTAHRGVCQAVRTAMYQS